MRTRAPHIQPIAARNRRGQGDRPTTALATTWIGPQMANRSRIPPMRSNARAFTLPFPPPACGLGGVGSGSTVAVEGDAVKLHAMVDEAEAEPLGDALLQLL